MAQQYYRVVGLEITAATIDFPIDGQIHLAWQKPVKTPHHYGIFAGASGVFLDPTTTQVGSTTGLMFNWTAPLDGTGEFLWIIAFLDAAQNFGGSNQAMFGCQNNAFPVNAVVSVTDDFTTEIAPFTSNIENFAEMFRSNVTGTVTNIVPPSVSSGETGYEIYVFNRFTPIIREVIDILGSIFVPPTFTITRANAQDFNDTPQGPPTVNISALAGGNPGPQQDEVDILVKLAYFAPANAAGDFFTPNEGDQAGAPFASLPLPTPVGIALPCVPYCNSTCAMAMEPAS